MAKPGVVAPLAYTAGVVHPGVVAAQSSQVFARNFNGLVAAAPLAYSAYPYARYAGAPLAAPFAAPLAAPYSALPYTAPYAAPLAAPYAAPFASPYAAAYRYPYAF